jgi:hypothetical protein
MISLLPEELRFAHAERVMSPVIPKRLLAALSAYWLLPFSRSPWAIFAHPLEKVKIRGGYSTMRFAYGAIPNLCQRKS